MSVEYSTKESPARRSPARDSPPTEAARTGGRQAVSREIYDGLRDVVEIHRGRHWIP